MEWLQFAVIILTFAGLFIWNRTEANADRRDFVAGLRLMHNDMLQEMKDFHGRLCAIEERNKRT